MKRFRPQGALWQNNDFLFLWASQSVSFFGSQITGLALPLAAILLLDASTFEVAALAALTWLPYLFFSLPAGVWIDRLPRRPILMAADWGRALALGSIPLAYLLDALTLAAALRRGAGRGDAHDVLRPFLPVVSAQACRARGTR